jgi:hypothetical protein
MDLKTYLRAQWDRVLAGAFVGFGLLVLLLGWIGVSSTPYATEQVPYLLSGGILAVLLLGVGGTLWLSADLRDEWRKLDDLDSTLVSLRDLAAALAVEQPAAPAATRLEGDADEPLGSVAPVRTPRRRARPATVA